MNPTEIMGYAASLGVLLSFLMKDIKTLRVVNSIGCALFVIYGYMMLPEDSMPIIITNVAIIMINIYFLMKDRKKTNP